MGEATEKSLLSSAQEEERWILAQDQILFEVLTEKGEYRIYTDGRVEGFGKVIGVFNRFPLLYSEGLRQGLAHALECQECRKDVLPFGRNQEQVLPLQD